MDAIAQGFALKAILTALVVLSATLAVERAGPRLGGVVAGLPIVLGPGLGFLALRMTGAELATAATAALLSLSATQGFMLAYGLAAPRLRPAHAALGAIGAWLVLAAALRRLAEGGGVMVETPWPAALLYLAAAAVTRRALARPAAAAPAVAPVRRAMLLLRAGLAGLLVGVVTLAADRAGPAAAGLLLGFPVGMTMIALTVHQRLGAAGVVAALHGAALGLLSLGAFCFATALISGPLSPFAALGVAICAALAVSAALAARLR